MLIPARSRSLFLSPHDDAECAGPALKNRRDELAAIRRRQQKRKRPAQRRIARRPSCAASSKVTAAGLNLFAA
jgi:hypothetical protein